MQTFLAYFILGNLVVTSFFVVFLFTDRILHPSLRVKILILALSTLYLFSLFYAATSSHNPFQNAFAVFVVLFVALLFSLSGMVISTLTSLRPDIKSSPSSPQV